jgi:hypothetical protein
VCRKASDERDVRILTEFKGKVYVVVGERTEDY